MSLPSMGAGSTVTPSTGASRENDLSLGSKGQGVSRVWMAGATKADPVALTARPYYQLLMRVITNG